MSSSKVLLSKAWQIQMKKPPAGGFSISWWPRVEDVSVF